VRRFCVGLAALLTDDRGQAFGADVMTIRGLLMFLLWAPLALGAEDAKGDPANDAQLLANILAAQQKVETVQGKFTQRTTHKDDEPNEPPFVLTARFAIKQPDHYNLVVSDPKIKGKLERTCSDGKKRWNIDIGFEGDEPTVSTKTIDPNDDEDPFRRITSFFRIDRAELEKEFKLAAEKSDAGSRLSLTPINPGLAEQIERIFIDLDGEFHTTSILMYLPDGARIAITIDEAVYNKPIDDAEFVYNSTKP
jgi:outer membrane lipoprotein-sorting protein